MINYIDIFRKRWYTLRRRCTDKNFKDYPYYGGRGITYEWESFDHFYNDMYDSFHKHITIHGGMNTTLERIDGNGNYCKSNCQWATRLTQARTRMVNRFFCIGGINYSMTEVSEMIGIKYGHLRQYTTYFHSGNYRVPIAETNEFCLLRVLRKDQKKCLICDRKYHCLGLCEGHYRHYYKLPKIQLKTLKGKLQKLNT